MNLRNWLFDREILKQRSFDVPVICVGNITVGGTGKTPISVSYPLALKAIQGSSTEPGYKRKSRGFRVVETDSRVQDVGDEPLQIERKFPDRWFSWMQTVYEPSENPQRPGSTSRPDVILLDDGFQHRRVKPSLSILLVDSNRPVFEDELLPAGLLREPLSGKNRASIVLVTKCHPDMQPIDFRIYSNGLDLYPFQKLYFTSLEYGAIRPLFPELGGEELELNDLRKKHLFLVTGIASPAPLVDKLEHKTYNLYTKFFPDHHSFTKENIRSIWRMVASVDDPNKIILTTEKDAVRFQSLPFLEEEMKRILYYIPVRISFINENKQESFNNHIHKHVRNYQANRRLPGEQNQ